MAVHIKSLYRTNFPMRSPKALGSCHMPAVSKIWVGKNINISITIEFTLLIPGEVSYVNISKDFHGV